MNIMLNLKILHSVIGTDVAGEVIEVGQGVKKFKPGDKVVGMVNPFVSCCVYYIFMALFICKEYSCYPVPSINKSFL